MGEETSEALYTVILTKIQDEEAKKKVAETLSRVTTNLPVDKASQADGVAPVDVDPAGHCKKRRATGSGYGKTRRYCTGFSVASGDYVTGVGRNTGCTRHRGSSGDTGNGIE